VVRVFLGFLATATVLLVSASAAEVPTTPEGQIKKVLPLFLDLEGRHTVSPSLFDRDAYQAYLRNNPEKVTGLRFDVLWKARRAEGGTLTVRVELRGLYKDSEPRETALEQSFEGQAKRRGWLSLTLDGEAFEEFGKVTAWRATLWCDGEMLDEYKSFLW
jgi:hypothetical protein